MGTFFLEDFALAWLEPEEKFILVHKLLCSKENHPSKILAISGEEFPKKQDVCYGVKWYQWGKEILEEEYYSWLTDGTFYSCVFKP